MSSISLPPNELLAGITRGRGRQRWVVLVTGFDAPRLLASWQSWRADADRCRQLHVVVVDPLLPSRSTLAEDIDGHDVGEAARELLAAWPPLTPNLHRLPLSEGDLTLWLAPGTLLEWLPELVMPVDRFVLVAPPEGETRWPARAMKGIGRLAAVGSTVSIEGPAEGLVGGLRSAGFVLDEPADVTPSVGPPIVRLAFAPVFALLRPRVRSGPVAEGCGAGRVTVIGAGLAGCAAAGALAAQGCEVTVIERHDAIACEGSGNPAGLFHGIVNSQDGLHARFNRAAALEAARAVRLAIEGHGVAGAVEGLLRRSHAATMSAATMQTMLAALRLPTGYVQALNAAEAEARSGLRCEHPAWFYPSGGWVDPAGLARSFLVRGGGRIVLQTGICVDRLEPTADGGWQLFDRAGSSVGNAPKLVLANAGEALRLLGSPAWPIERVRGQISSLPASAWPTKDTPRLPVTGSGYVLPVFGDRVMFGATAQPGDHDPTLRDADHLLNLERLRVLTGFEGPIDLSGLTGRTAWRWSANDRLPVIGAVPAPEDAMADVLSARGTASGTSRLEQPRHVPRRPGLYVCTAFGSRGITWAALAGQVLASIVTGSPSPVEASLLDAVDPARFVSRAARGAARKTRSSMREGPPRS